MLICVCLIILNEFLICPNAQCVLSIHAQMYFYMQDKSFYKIVTCSNAVGPSFFCVFLCRPTYILHIQYFHLHSLQPVLHHQHTNHEEERHPQVVLYNLHDSQSCWRVAPWSQSIDTTMIFKFPPVSVQLQSCRVKLFKSFMIFTFVTTRLCVGCFATGCVDVTEIQKKVVPFQLCIVQQIWFDNSPIMLNMLLQITSGNLMRITYRCSLLL